MDYESESEEDVLQDPDKLKEEKQMWKNEGWKFDPRSTDGHNYAYGPRLKNLDSQSSELAYFLHFLPVNYIKTEMLPAVNKIMEENGYSLIDFTELIYFLVLLYSMKIYKLPERRMYWDSSSTGIFIALDYGRFMSWNRLRRLCKLCGSHQQKILMSK